MADRWGAKQGWVAGQFASRKTQLSVQAGEEGRVG